MSTVIQVSNLSKIYRLGEIGTGTLSRDLERWYKMRIRGQADPFLKIGETNQRDKKGVSDVVYALRDINFEVQQGEALGIIGKNGAGKSTLLKILSRVTSPTTGKINIKGRVASLLEVGTGFHPELTGRENIYLNGAILGMRKKEITRKLDEIIDFSGVERYIDTPVKRYSSGMYVRLAFAVAAHLESEILIVDEVLAVGDFEFRKKCLGKMQDVSQTGRTVLFVTHDMGSISNLCSKTIWLDSGNIHTIGDSKDMISQYVSSGAILGGEVIWSDMGSAPGNENVRLMAARIKSNSKITADIMIDNEIRIEIDYWNLKDGAVLFSNMHLWDKMNDLVLASANMPSASLSIDPWVEKPQPQGLYRSVCVIPANFLNSEHYSIGVGIQNDRLEWQVWQQNLLSFEVHETGEMKKEYMGYWGGVVRPKFNWITKYLIEDDIK
jgi:lipopolysaccharide transport system ATP-binding protein